MSEQKSPIAILVGSLLLTGLVLSQLTCWVDGRCRTDTECEFPQVCTADGACVLECARDEECELEEVCQGNQCSPAIGCAGCRFDHADPICLHGDCQMGECHLGWVDTNTDPVDGCEYGCVPTGDEACDTEDNDCDGFTDEDYDLLADPDHCRECNHACPAAAHTLPVCEMGVCTYLCQEGWFDNDAQPENGCEDDVCISTGEERCDGRDNDCNGEVDEGFDRTLPESCGHFCTECEFDHATPLCVDWQCQMGACDENWHNFDVSPLNGCESYCVPQGDEVCNGEDDDCDGHTDEGIVCCPEDMVSVENRFCIDIYEAHLEVNEGGDLMAVATVDAMPYWSRTLRAEEAEGYCAAAGKRLCTAAEWVMVCRGPDDTEYCYGDTYEPTTCNGIDAFGGTTFDDMPTGTFEECTNEYGVFDINGNVWELATDGLAHGGAYNCLDSARLHQCSFTIDPDRVVAIGFRCCQ